VATAVADNKGVEIELEEPDEEDPTEIDGAVE